MMAIVDHREGRIVLGTLSQPLRNGSCEVAMGWEAVQRPVRVCEGGGWYTAHPTNKAWLLRTWMEHKGRPAWSFGPVADERHDNLEEMVASAAISRARNYGFGRTFVLPAAPHDQPQVDASSPHQSLSHGDTK